MKKIFILLIAITFMMGAYPIESAKADEGNSVFNGLYLINGEVELKSVQVDISVDSSQTSRVTAAYEMTNTGKETQYLTLGTPIASLNITNYKNSYTPYQYNSIIVNGNKINQQIEQLDVDFDNWRNYSFEIPLKPGETKTATISYTTENKQAYAGNVTFDMDMQHLKSWGKTPKELNINASFNPKTVKIYNFDNTFNVKPTEITPEYGYIWKMQGKDVYKDINFSYYFIDDEILKQLNGLKSGQINTMVASYKNKNYKKVIESGKKYIANSKNGNNQNKVYLLMVDAYVSLKQYNEAIAVYDLIEPGLSDFGDIEEKIESKVLYNKVICYRELKQYENMYDLIEYELDYSDLNTYMVNWLEKQKNLIPENELMKIKENYREATSLEKFSKKFLQGEFHTFLLLGILVVMIVVILVIFIQKKKKKNRFFY